MLRGVLAAGLAVGCGRLGFDARGRPAADATGLDAAALDATAAPPSLQSVSAPGFGSAAAVSGDVVFEADDFLLAAAYWDEAPDTVTLADTAGLSWTALQARGVVASCGGPTGNATGAQLYYATAPAAGSDTVTISQSSGTQPLGLFLFVYRGIAGVSASTGNAAPASTTAMAAPPIDAPASGVVVAFFNDTIGVGVVAAGSGFTAEARDEQFPNLVEDAIVTGGAYTATATLPNGPDACWVTSVVALSAR